jgi:misacylated tRNA(Ala) deacylase
VTELLFLSDAYLRDFEAHIEQASEHRVILSRTAFYPGGGGQPNDSGVLQTQAGIWQVVRLHREAGEIWHELNGDHPPTGACVQGHIDWDRRYQLMRTHTAMHILCGVIWRDYGACVTGGNMEPLQGRMDFEFERMSRDLVEEIEGKINLEVAAARAVKTKILPREEAFNIPDLIRTKINLLPEHIREVRIVEIEGLDLQADGGTHVGNTKEVGPISIIDYKSKGAINKRIVVSLEP